MNMKLFLTPILRFVYILSIFFVAVFLVCTFHASFAAPAPLENLFGWRVRLYQIQEPR